MTSKTNPVAGRYLRAPDVTGQRRAEGGLRIRGVKPGQSAQTPLVSVITVCFNSEKTLSQAIASVRGQTYRAIEHLVIDGGSGDGTCDILKAHDDYLDYYVSEPDGGIYEAMNKGLSLAQGAHILFLNSDDWYEPHCVETLVRAKQASGADVVSALANYVDEQGRFVRVQPESPFDAGVAFRMPLRHETMLIPAWLYNRTKGYDTSFRINADRAFTADLYHAGYSHHLVAQPLLNFRMSGVSSVGLDGLYAERERMLRDRFPGLAPAALRELSDLERISPERLLQIARSYRMPALRAACIAYALDREAQGHKPWQDIDVDAFSPVLSRHAVTNAAAAARRRAEVGTSRPKVSVILPVYNGEATLAACLDSLLAQTMDDFEVICVNDQTPDGSQAVVEAYIARDQRIKSRVNETNVGLGTSRNRGISVSRGDWIFHVDPDDTLPPDALAALLAAAETHGSDIVRGAFLHEQMMVGKAGKPTRKGPAKGAAPEVNLTLADRPDLLKSTEGHWACLYRADFAKRVFYPEDLKMGQDSIFLVEAYIQARSITLIPDLVYHYHANPESAMNVFDLRKYIDEIEWRSRAWRALSAVGLPETGAHLLCNYWNPPALAAFNERFAAPDKQRFFRRLSLAFAEAGNTDLAKTKTPTLRTFFAEALRQFGGLAAPVSNETGKALPDNQRLRIAVLSTFDNGGAGLAARRSVQGLRAAGHDARLYSVFKRTGEEYVWQMAPRQAFHAEGFDPNTLHAAWRRVGVLTHEEQPKLVAHEMMSKPGCLLDPKTLHTVISEADIVHIHWATGMLDYDVLPGMVGDIPVVWTLHDMLPFTGGCHYSEGCEGFRDACDPCPLVSRASDLPAWAQSKKRAAVAAIPSVTVISPSTWLADLAAASAIFAGRRVETIPNIFPAEAFQPVPKPVARQRLGLPLDRKLFVFGADSLSNSRKGGDLLGASLDHLRAMGEATDVEGVFFGAGTLEIGLPVHNMGFVKDPQRLSLIYAAADVFAFPSREDNAPQTVLEALLSGTPVVSFPVGYVPDLLKHRETGYLAEFADTKDFAEGLSWAFARAATPQAQLDGLTGYLDAAQHNDPDASLARHLALYRSLLEAKKAPPARELADAG